MDGAKQFVVNGSFRERQQQGLVHRTRGPLRRWVELSDGLDLVAKKFNTHRTVCFRQIDIRMPPRNAYWPGISATWSKHSQRYQMTQQVLDIDGLATPHQPCQVRVVLRRAQTDRGCRNGGDHDRRCAALQSSRVRSRALPVYPDGGERYSKKSAHPRAGNETTGLRAADPASSRKMRAAPEPVHRRTSYRERPESVACRLLDATESPAMPWRKATTCTHSTAPCPRGGGRRH